MLNITSLQCRRARGLLGWNLRDLNFKSGVQSHRIHSFERALIHLRQDENKAIYIAFKEEGIVFEEYGEVRLDKDNAVRKDRREVETQHLGNHFDVDRTTIDEEEYRRLTGLAALTGQPTQAAKKLGRAKHGDAFV